MKRFFGIFLVFVISMTMCINVFALKPCVSWYCIRNKEHKQPNLPSELSFVQDYNLIWCDKENDGFNDGEKVIYLTFDAGYENGNIEKIVDVLSEENVKATFFILDNMILKNKDLVGRMINDGHLIANHTMKHKDMTKFTNIEDFEKELTSLEELYKSTFGVEMKKIYRPPEGKVSEENLKWAKELGYTTVMWSFAYDDWDNNRQPSCDIAMKKILCNLHNGEIMLLHPTSKTNASIMKSLIKELKAKGYRFATVDEIC